MKGLGFRPTTSQMVEGVQVVGAGYIALDVESDGGHFFPTMHAGANSGCWIWDRVFAPSLEWHCEG